MVIYGITVIAAPGVAEEEIHTIVTDEQAMYAAQGKAIASIEISIDRDELVIKSKEKSPIRRVRRITGYLSEQHNFNDAKQAELRERVTHGYEQF